MSEQPTRLFEDPEAGAALRADLEVAKDAKVEGFNKTAGLVALQAAVATHAATTATGLSLLAKIAAAVIVVGGGAVVWLGIRPTPPSPSGSGGRGAPVVSAPSKPEPAPTVEEEPEPEPPGETPPEDDTAEPETAPKKPTPKEPTRKDPPLSLEEQLLREAATINDARKALASEPARALALTRQAKQDFPRGQLAQEREALAIRALAQLGRADEAKTRAEAYLRRHPRGPHADAVRRAVGMK